MERMLLWVVDALAVALEILSGLTRTQIVLLSCATVVEHCFLNVIAGTDGMDWSDWEEDEQTAFVCKFSNHVSGIWDQERILKDWEELAKVS